MLLSSTMPSKNMPAAERASVADVQSGVDVLVSGVKAATLGDKASSKTSKPKAASTKTTTAPEPLSEKTKLDFAKLANKITYATHPHIIERVMQYACVPALLALRATCKALCDRADRVFGSHVEVHMSSMELVFETPGERVIKGQRIPAFKDRGPIEIGVDMMPFMAAQQAGGNVEPQDVWFKVPRDDVPWFNKFLGRIQLLDFHGSTMTMILPGLERDTFAQRDPYGRVAVKAAKVPTVRMFPSHSDDGLTYATMCPFYAADTVQFAAMTQPNLDPKKAWLYTAPSVPASTRELTLNVHLNAEQNWGSQSRIPPPLRYHQGIKEVNILFGITAARPSPHPSFGHITTPDAPGCLQMSTIQPIITKIFLDYRPDIRWTLVGVDGMQLEYPGMGVIDGHRLNLILLCMIGLMTTMPKTAEEAAARTQPSASPEELIAKIAPHVGFATYDEFFAGQRMLLSDPEHALR